MFTTDAARKDFYTSDGVRLSYLEMGSGQPLILVPGWSQTAIQWHHQIASFSATHRVMALDMRGHGASDKPGHGYRVSRFARDLREFMTSHDLNDAILMGHSMGCAVIVCLWDLHGDERIDKLILADQGAFLSSNRILSEEDKRNAGAGYTEEMLVDRVIGLNGPHSEEVTRTMLERMFTPSVDPDMLETVIALNLDMPRAAAASLLFNCVHEDWRDVYARISVPTLCIGAEASVFPTDAIAWQAREIPSARIEVFEANEGGSHFMFMENPEKFNAVVADFLANS
ncbi:MAG: alpha/beta hydrolase [Pseudomonadota bacterium]